jgi:hypothetical protein
MAGCRDVVVEVIIGDCVSMYVGRVVDETDRDMTLVDVAWVGNTGARHRFFAADYDEHVEVSPYPDGVTVRLPVPYIRTDWPHALLREPR